MICFQYNISSLNFEIKTTKTETTKKNVSFDSYIVICVLQFQREIVLIAYPLNKKQSIEIM